MANFLLGGSAFAQEGFHFGGTLGIGRSDIRTTHYFSGVAGVEKNANRSGISSKVFGGYRFNNYLEVEAGYVDLGKSGLSAVRISPILVGPNGAFAVSNSFQQSAFFVDIVGILPIADRLEIIVRAGVHRWRSSRYIESSGVARVVGGPTFVNKGDGEKFGIGARYRIWNHVSLRVDWEHYQGLVRFGPDTAIVGKRDHFGAGVQYNW